MNHLGIYIHIPFCRQKCSYCDFYSLPCGDEKQMDTYLEALLMQLGEYFPGSSKTTVDTVYIGGGTPSVFGGKRLEKLLKALAKRVTLVSGCEITVEVNPESCDKKLFQRLKSVGVNRISMGVQSADDGQLRAIGRLHDFAGAKEAAELCRKYCTDNLSLDLMYGLPGQTMESWQRSVEEILTLRPRHVSAYALKLEEGTPLQRQNPILPEDDVQADMYLYAVDRLQKAGLRQYEISNFAWPGYQSRHNSRYWDLSPYLGLGCGAHSYYGGKRFSFVRDMDAYLDGVQGKGRIVEQEDEMEYDNRSGEYVMLQLRTAAGIDEDVFYNRFGMEFAPCAKRLEKYIVTEHVIHDRGSWRLTPKGFLVSNVIISDVLEALGQPL